MVVSYLTVKILELIWRGGTTFFLGIIEIIFIYISSLCFEQYQTVMVVDLDTTETDQVREKPVMEEVEEVEVVTEHQEQVNRMTVFVSETPDKISFHLLISIMASYCNSYLGHNIIHLINAFK